MRISRITITAAVLAAFGAVSAGPEIYDPLEVYKKANSATERPATETVVAGKITERARFTYQNGLLVRTEFLTAKNEPAGHSVFEYENSQLKREQLFDAAGNLTEEIQYKYRAGRLEKSLVHDVRGNAKIEWQYLYDKAGNLVGGKRLLAGKLTESFKLVSTPGSSTQNIYNAKGELTSKVESVYESGLLQSRMKTGLVGARFAQYRYNTKKQLIEIIYHDTVKGEKVLVKKHQFDYSLNSESPKTALK